MEVQVPPPTPHLSREDDGERLRASSLLAVVAAPIKQPQRTEPVGRHRVEERAEVLARVGLDPDTTGWPPS
jgi:hypothetical protein